LRAVARPVGLAGNLEAKPLKEILIRWLLACGCFALLLYFFSPPWAAFRAWSRVPDLGGMVEVRRGVSVLQQVAHPGAPVADALHGGIQWRLLFPVIGKVLALPPAVLFGLAHVGCVAVLGFIITVLRRRGAAWTESVLAALTLGAGSWYFASVCWLGYFDSWLVLALLIVAFAQSPRSVWLACLWAPWVDERFVLAAPLALLCRALLLARSPAAAAWREKLKQEFSVPAALLLAFVLVRLGVLASLSGPQATVGGYWGTLNAGEAPWTRMAFGIWEGLRTAWFFVGAAVVLGWRQRGWAAALAVAVLGVMVVGLATAQDFSRSMMLVLPVALLGVVLAVEAARWRLVTLQVCAAVALLLPAHLVMSNAVNPVSSLAHELASLQSPPAAIMPEIYELRAIHAMEQGKFAQAEADLTLAIKLADNPVGPAKQRGVLYATAGRWADAKRDFVLMTEHAPESPDAWFFRAQAEQALGEGEAARADIEHALGLAPPEWSSRPDVTRFLTRLGMRK
jgi:tetratricopeptide (TPR) repeat protein